MQGADKRSYGVLKGNRRFFTTEDDELLRKLKNTTFPFTWAQISDCMPGFTARQLRERWCNYLSPTLKTGSWTEEEDEELMNLYREWGAKWGIIGTQLGNRAAPDIKNRYQRVKNKRDKMLRVSGKSGAGRRSFHEESCSKAKSELKSARKETKIAIQCVRAPPPVAAVRHFSPFPRTRELDADGGVDCSIRAILA
jgi:hypothetical protein